MKVLLTCLILFIAATTFGQRPLSVATSYVGIDTARAFILVQTGASGLSDFRHGLAMATDTFSLLVAPDTLRYDSSYRVKNVAGDTLALHFTPLPLLQIRSSTTINESDKVAGQLSYAHGAEEITSPIGVEYRGGFTLSYPKKNLDLEFREEADPEESANVSLAGMRDDDDWVLDAMYNEPSRLNGYVAHKVWLDLHELSYADEEPEARAGADLAYVEVFLNGEYSGLYTLGEQVDRKQLQLKDNKDGAIRGELYKSEDFSDATNFLRVPFEAPDEDDWAGWEMKHPDFEDGDWALLQEAIRFAGTSSDSLFQADAARRFDLDNIADYLLFINAMLLTDNTRKNLYLARYTADAPYFFVPWDLDAGLGNRYEGSRNTDTTVWEVNHLFRRLTDRSPANFSDRLCARYEELRDGVLHPDSLVGRVNQTMDRLQSSGAYARESARWPETVNYSTEQREFTTDIVRKRMAYLDRYVCAITTPTPSVASDDVAVLEVYPNPATRSVSFNRPNADRTKTTYALYSSTGRIVRKGTLGAGERQIGVAGIPGGLYVLRVGQAVTRLVINPR
ncbi:putative secreted protein (Por secretion system target) [Neolewinella xylanilytica]|uniref:Putative secreted protein (Por secretion system target) n=1 Tax=Neolewinella xylanilytica TaxID=1514080 RepID=A0A2S6I8U4_9BACT|nr:CotH kinase family protein [Neolewinella xylanilytica]PPK87902.1 putative secreted protein (Por secretion system target) [Neolewinella xylanilytica]